jgi:hypothetical protein
MVPEGYVMTDTPVDLRDVITALNEIKDALPGNTPVVVGTVPSTLHQRVSTHGVWYDVLAFAVWSTGVVSPICTDDNRVHCLDPEDTWHFVKNYT